VILNTTQYTARFIKEQNKKLTVILKIINMFLFTEIPTIGTDYLILMLTKGVRINKVDNKTANE
jgi:hypothetical protein